MYEPALIQLLPEIDNRGVTDVLDQGEEGACTGFGLAAAINLLNAKKRDAFLLFENDEWRACAFFK
ncbi:MAG: hypothetical protein J7L35_02665 [Anaerolineales bacterium]|nr:hypothetical protein [Anaerolineales bacterium]